MRQRFKWKEEHFKLLGNYSDKAVAVKIKARYLAVRYMRIKLGIPAFDSNAAKAAKFENADALLLSKKSDVEIAKTLGTTPYYVRKNRFALGIKPSFKPRPVWAKEQIALLGKTTDSKLAMQIGVSAATVHGKRVKMGIAPYRKHSKPKSRGD